MKIYRFYTLLIVFLLSGITFQLSAQVGINTMSPSNGAMLDINSTDKGLLIPRMSSAARNLVPSPAAGLLIYDTTTNLFNYFNGSYWYHVDTTFVSFISGKNSPGGGVSVSSLPDKLPDSSAMLDISDPARGFLLTRTTPDLITAPENGLIIYDISDNLLKYYQDGNWLTLCSFTKLEAGVTGSQSSEGVAINVNGAGPHHSAILDVSSASRGVLIPRLTSLQRDDILPVNGLAIFNTDSKAIEYYNGSEWLRMNIILPVSIIIEANVVEVCAGTGATFTATAVNGGETPLFQWHVNNSPVSGATNAVYSYIPGNNDHVTCVLTSSINCVSGNPDTSNVVIMTVNPLLPVSISIIASANPACFGTTVTFAATPVNGGPNPSFQWKVNGSDVLGATNSTYAFVPVNNESITCVLTSGLACISGSPAVSNVVMMTMNPLLPVSIVVTPSANPVCAETEVTFTSAIVNGGTLPTYQWMVNGVSVSGATNAVYNYVPVNGNIVTCVLTSNANCTTNNPAASNPVVMTVNPLLPVSIVVTPSANPVCAGTAVNFTSAIVNGGTAPAYQWRVNGVPVSGATNAAYNYIPVNGNIVTCVLTSNATCAINNPATSNEAVMTVNPLLPVSVAVAPSANPVCAETAVTFTATPVNGGPNPAYEWKVNSNIVSGATNATYTFNPSNANTVSCTLLSNALCTSGNPATSNTVTMVVNPLLPVSVSITASANPVCAGTPVTYTATPVNGGTNPSYQWRLNAVPVSGATNAAYTFVPVNGNVITCVLTSNAICPTGNPATSNAITMTVNPLKPVSITITESANTVCAGTMVTFTSSKINGGSLPAYQWMINGSPVSGATNASYAYVPVNDDIVTCVLTSNAVCAIGNPATSNAVVMVVNPLEPVSITIAESVNTICAGTEVTFASSTVNGGTSPAYQWFVNGAPVSAATSATYSYIPENDDSVTCVVTSNAICPTGNPDTSNIVIMVVNPLEPVSITISESANTICAGTKVTFTSSIVNGGVSPAYQWVVNEVPVSAATDGSYSFDPVNNDEVKCILTSNATCPTGNPATSNLVTMIVNPLLPVSITITPSANPVCAGTQVTFSSTVINGGIAPVYQWALNGTDISGATDAAYTYAPADKDSITCTVTSNAICPIDNPATSNVVAMTVNPLLPVSISITPSENPVCAGTSVTFNSSVNNGGPGPVYQWTLNGSDITGATDATYTFIPVNDDAITCTVISNAICPIDNPDTSNVVTMIVNPLLPVSISITPSANPVCAGTSVTFNSSVNNGGTAPVYQWTLNGLDIAGATDATYTYVPVDVDAITCTVISNAICPIDNPDTSNVVTMTVNPLLPVSVTILPSANPVCAGTEVTYTATPVNGGSSPQYQWMVNGANVSGATNPTYSFVPDNTNKIKCVLTSSEACAILNPDTSNIITMTVNPLLPVSLTISVSVNPVCATNTVTFTATPVNPGPNPVYQWKVNGTNVAGATSATYAYVPVNNDLISCTLTSNATCAVNNPANSTNTITMTVIPLVPVSVNITASLYAVMPGTPVTFTATTVNGGTSPAYQWKVNGTAVAGATNAVYTYTSTNGVDNDLVHCVVTSSLTVPCVSNNPATSNTIVLIIYHTGTPCAGIPTISYGGLTYNTVQIGTQCWLRENLNIGTRINRTQAQANNGIVEKYCYRDSVKYCDVYGGLYQWGELMQYVTTSGAQGICPSGWHVPTTAQWETLTTFAGGSELASGKLKESGTTHWANPNVSTNEFGFTALPGGLSSVASGFAGITRNGQFYTSTQQSSTNAWVVAFTNGYPNVTVLLNYKTTSASVRCLKN